jgi:formylglycine-generating enzyme required for sulfatase activity
MIFESDFAHIPAGPFIYGPEECYERLEQCPPLRPKQTLALPEFWLAKKPVTYREWLTFLEETGHQWIGTWYKVVAGWRGVFIRAYAPTNEYPNGHDEYPIVDVTQSDAYAYCEWLSEKMDRKCALPSEEQWEKAARSTDGRKYPWGNEEPRPEIQWQKKFPVGLETYAFSLLNKPQREWARAGWYWRNGHPWQVGQCVHNVSPFGCIDMSGNIWEWTSSLYNPTLPDFHVVKGGSWGYSIHHTKLNVRSACSVSIPSRVYHAQGTGFRVMIEA